MEKQTFLETKSICKSFGPTKALVDINFSIGYGEVRGLIGENGSGKSTLASVIVGLHKPDSGAMLVREKPYAPKDMLDAVESGISMMVQEMNTVSGISVAANIFAGREHLFCRNKILSVKKMEAAAREVLEGIHAGYIDAGARIDAFSFEERKIVEMARAIWSDPTLFIVDETTTALSQKGRDFLYKMIRRLKEDGRSVIFISHDLSEVMRVCDTVTVMRDGHIVKHLEGDAINVDNMRRNMVGREISGSYYREDDLMDFNGDKVVYEARNITSDALKGVSFELHAGEIFGIGGLADCGMHDLGKVLFGLKRAGAGQSLLKRDGGDVELKNPRIAIRNKVGYVSKNRDVEALMLQASLKDNICLPSLGMLEKRFFIGAASERKMAEEQIRALSIKTSGIHQLVLRLSGGNKQKVALGRWLANQSSVLILDCPTRGIDIGAKAAIYRLMERIKKEGKAIIMISEELTELIGMSDRLMIMKDGRCERIFNRDERVTEEAVVKYMI